MLALVEENVAIKVPVGAEYIQSPGKLLRVLLTGNDCARTGDSLTSLSFFMGAAGHLYHIKWVQDEKGSLKMQDYCIDPVSAIVDEKVAHSRPSHAETAFKADPAEV
jgi:hypothetical protein